MKWYLGIDDTSRCPVIGSLFIAGVLASERTIRMFRRAGVKDSKLLTKQKRYKLLPLILQHSYVSIRQILPKEISNKYKDADGNVLNLNDKEIVCYLGIARSNEGHYDMVFVDNFDRNREAFLKRAQKFYNTDWSKWVIEHNADEKYTIVGAASIVAKCMSDIEMDSLREQYDLGSGNPNDSKTEAFILKHIKHKRCSNGCQWIRWNWHTIERLKGGTKNDIR